MQMPDSLQLILLTSAVVLFLIIFFLTLKKAIFRISIAHSGAKTELVESRTIHVVIFVLSAIVFFGGLYGIYLESLHKDKAIREELQMTARNIANGLTYRTIAPLQFTIDDLDHPVYLKVCEQLKLASTSLNGMDIKIMKLSDSTIVFGPESIPPDSEKSSLPGDIYKSAPDGLLDVFLTGRLFTVGPYVDEFGQFLSAYAPVYRPRSFTPDLVIGVDLEFEVWQREISQTTVSLLFALNVFLLLLLGGFFWFNGRRISEFEGTRWWQSPQAIFTFLACVVLTIVLTKIIVVSEKRYRSVIFEQTTSLQASQINSFYRLFETRLNLIASRLSSMDELSDTDFQSLVSTLLTQVSVASVGLYVESENESNQTNKVNGIVMMEPKLGVPFDIGNNLPELSPNTAKLIHHSMETGLTNTEGPYSIRSSEVSYQIVYVPVNFSSTDRNNGVLFCIIDSEAMLKDAIALRSPNQAFFDVFLVEDKFDSEPENIAVFMENPLRRLRDSDLRIRHSFFIFGKSYQIVFYPGDKFDATHREIAMWVALPIGILLTILLSIFVGILSTRKNRFEKQVQIRTSELRSSEQKFASLFTAMAEGVVLLREITSPEGRIVDYSMEDANAAYCQISGKSRQDIVGYTIKQIYGKDYPYLHHFISVSESRHPIRVEDANPSKTKFYEISVTAWEDNGLAVVYNDISERVHSERVMRESEEKYRIISDNVGDVIWVLDLFTRRFTYMSPSIERMSGYTLAEASELSLEDLLTKDSQDFVYTSIPQRIQQYIEGEREAQTVYLNQRIKDGTIRITEVVSSLIADDSGMPKELLGVTRDITEKFKAEEALKLSEEKYRILIENQNDFIIKVDTQGRYLYASPSFCKTFAKSEEELIGKIYIPPMDKDDVSHSLDALAKLNVPPYRVSFEQRVKTSKGWKWISWDNSTLLENGVPVGFIGVGRDVTLRKEYEIELEESRKRLQIQNEEYAMLNEEYQSLNEELRSTNDELMQAIERAQESDNLKTAFLQNMSHEIRTPLNAIIGFSEMLTVAGFNEDERTGFSEIIVNSSRQLLGLVNDIMTISTLEAKQEKLTFSEVNLPDKLKELDAVFQARAREKGIALYPVIPEDIDANFIFIIDELKFTQVFNNLIGNAIKFTPYGEVTFGFSMQENETIRFFVKDTGIGIPDHLRKKIFERFRQAGSEVQKKYGGTGLGLAISKGHVELMGGKIWVESVPDKGSAFYFDIPIRHPKA
jgi:PAS domain S-box-containing protein